MLKRILCVLLAGLMLISIVACNKGGNDTDTNKGTTGNKNDREYLDDLPDNLNFNKQEVRFIVEEGSNGSLSKRSIFADEASGDVVDNAVFNRNQNVNERLNVEVKLLECTGPCEIPPLLRQAVKANTDDYDVIGLYQYYGITVATESVLLNMNDFIYNDFDREYWGTSYIDAMSYNDKIFWATGDMALRYTGGMYVTYVNDTLWNEYYTGQDIYKMVDNHEWTIDKMMELSSAVYDDANINNKVDEKDTAGLALIFNDVIAGMCTGLGVEYTAQDEEGNTIVNINNEHVYSVYEKLYKLTHNNPGYINFPTVDDSISLMKHFAEGRYMMTVNKLYQTEIYLTDMEDTYKIIPLPKFDEDQKDYYTRIHDSVTIFGVPTTALNNSNVISATLEAVASESYELVRPAYYEVALKTRYARDTDSGRMIDLIAKNVRTDFVTMYSFNLHDIAYFIPNNLAGNTESISSKLKSVNRAWGDALENLQEAIEEASEE